MTQQFTTISDSLTLNFGDSVELTGEIVYDQHNAMLYLITDEDSEVLSITLDEYGLIAPTGCVWIKDWSEHVGVAAQLADLALVRIQESASIGPFDAEAHLVKIVTE